MRSLQITYSPGENHPREKVRGAWSRGTRVESSTNAGAEKSGRWVRVGLCVCQRDRRAGDCCRRMRVPWVAHLDGLHGFWISPTAMRALLVFPSAPGCSRAPHRVPERPQVFPSASLPLGGSRAPLFPWGVPEQSPVERLQVRTCLETSTCFRYILSLAVGWVGATGHN